MSESVDVVIAGAGPAGAAAAALLADHGCSVVVLEREEFPRFHIGESLLPLGLSVLERLGIAVSEEIFVHKQGARFLDEAGGREVSFDFDQALEGPPRHAFHVDRARFDALLADRAVAAGAEVRHGVEVGEVEITDAGVRLSTSAGEVRARYLVDATGQSRLLARRAKAVAPYRNLGRAAAFRHYSNLTLAALEELGPSGDIRVLLVPDGWGWIIPMPGGRLSVGRVSRLGGMKTTDVDALVRESPLLRRLTEGAAPGPARLAANFSYKNLAPFGARYGCIGDSACFLDPVFSSGVSLALAGAEDLADRLAPALLAGCEGDPELMAPLRDRMDDGYRVFATLIDRFYNTRMVDNIFFGAPADGDLHGGIVSVLAGDVWREDNRFRSMLLRARRPAPSPDAPV